MTPDTPQQAADLITAVLLVALLGGFGLLLSLAFAGEREPFLKWLVYVLLACTWGLAGLVGVALAAAGVASARPELGDVLSEALRAQGFRMSPAMSAALLSSGAALVAAAAAGPLLLVPALRRGVSRLIPIEPDRLVHAVALQYALLLVATAVVNLAFFNAIVGQGASTEDLEALGRSVSLTVLWAQAIGFVALAWLGAGFVVRRDGAATLARLGLTRAFSVRWWAAATVVGLATAFAVDASWALTDPGAKADLDRVVEALFGPILQTGLAGAITIGVSAGVGEEILFRGALQPRFGLLATAALFTVMHTQYSISPALGQVFIMGLLLGLVRQRANTTTAIAAHGTYNFIIAALAIYGGELAP